MRCGELGAFGLVGQLPVGPQNNWPPLGDSRGRERETNTPTPYTHPSTLDDQLADLTSVSIDDQVCLASCPKQRNGRPLMPDYDQLSTAHGSVKT